MCLKSINMTNERGESILETSIFGLILLQVLLIALNAIFACAEIAIISMNDNKLAKMAADGDKRAVRLVNLTEQPAKFLATIQVAITLSGFLGSAFAAENFSDLLVDWVLGMGVVIPRGTLDAIAVVIITLVLSYFTLVFGELVPKRVAMNKAESIALGLSGLICGIAKLFKPIVWFLTVSTNAVLRLMGIDPNQEDEEVGEEEIKMMVDAGTEKGAIDHEEKEFIENVFEFDNLTAGEIATHRTEVNILLLEDSDEEWKEVIHGCRHTLYPVCGESADDVVGILNAKDYFRLEDKSRENVMKNAVKPAYFVPDNVKADVLFRNMKHNRFNMAIVLDEYGGMSGIVTITDLVEQLVGDLDGGVAEDETECIRKIGPDTWKVGGRTLLEDVSEALGVKLFSEEFETFNGLIFGALSAVPEDGSSLEIETQGLLIKTSDISDHLVKTAVVRVLPKVEESEEE